MIPLVTIGLPTYNNRDTILAAIKSVFAQTFANWELLIVDDGSDDGTPEVIRGLDHPRITVLKDGRNEGLTARLNQITRLATGRYLARMDADDIMHPERIERQLRHLSDNPRIDLLGTAMISIDGLDRPTGMRTANAHHSSMRSLLTHATIIHPSVMGKTSWFLSNPYDETYRRAQDHELWVRTYGNAVVENLDEPLMFVREAGTITARKYATSAKATRGIIRKYGPALVGRSGTASLLAASYAKQAAYYALEQVNAIDKVVGKRNAPLSDPDREMAERVISQILATELPLSGIRTSEDS